MNDDTPEIAASAETGDAEFEDTPEQAGEVEDTPAEDTPSDETADQDAPAASDPAAIVRAAVAAGCPEMAADLIEAGASVEDATARFEAASTIRSLCSRAGRPEMASGLIASGASVNDTRAALFDALVEGDASVEARMAPADAEKSRQTAASRAVSMPKPDDVFAQRREEAKGA